jgi:predicted enzyme related to lactoylglutathione lyase
MPRPVHFEIHAENTDRAIAFYNALFGWEFKRWADQPYWLVMTGDPKTPGIDGGLMPRRGSGPTAGQPVSSFVCTMDVADLDATLARVPALGGTVCVPKMAVATIGWLAYANDTEGNIFGMMQMDANAA